MSGGTTIIFGWRPPGWKTLDTSETIRRVTSASLEVTEEAVKARQAASGLQQAAEEFARHDTEALRSIAEHKGDDGQRWSGT